MQDRLDAQQKQIELLMKMVPKSTLARHMPNQDFGQTIKVSTYRESIEDKPRLVTGWSLVKNHVRVTKMGIEEDLRIRVNLEGGGKSSVKQINGYKLALSNAKDESKIKELKDKIEAAENGTEQIEMELKDFYNSVEKVTVNVDTEKTAYEKDGMPKEFTFEWDGKTHTLLAPYVN